MSNVLKEPAAVHLSLVIPYYFGENFIISTITSILESHKLNKNHLTVPNIELIINIDSMETDLQIIDDLINVLVNGYCSYRVYKNEKNNGVAKTRNLGISMANGTNILCIDQDDTINPSFFNEITKVILDQNEFIVYNGNLSYRGTNELSKIFYIKPIINLKNIILYDIIKSPGQVIVKKKLYSQHLFPSSINNLGADDKFCWIAIFNEKEPTYYYIHKPLYTATIHSGNFSNDYKQLTRCVIELWDVYLTTQKLNSKTILLANKNLLFCKYQLNELHGYKKILGLMFYIKYYTRLNKLLGFFIKKITLRRIQDEIC